MTTIHGTQGADTLTGTASNDLLLGDSGNDVYRFGIGSGQDTIAANANNQTVKFLGQHWLPVVEFGPGIQPADLIVSSAAAYGGRAQDLMIRVAGTTDSLLIVSQLEMLTLGTTVEHFMTTFKFANGETWSASDVANLTSGSSDYLQGVNRNAKVDVIDGGAGQDTLYGHNVSTLRGGAGDDYLVAGGTLAAVDPFTGNSYYASTPRMEGGAGDDVLAISSNRYLSVTSKVSGGAGDDYLYYGVMDGILPVTYEYSRGFGSDVLDGSVDWYDKSKPSKTIAFDATIKPEGLQGCGRRAGHPHPGQHRHHHQPQQHHRDLVCRRHHMDGCRRGGQGAGGHAERG